MPAGHPSARLLFAPALAGLIAALTACTAAPPNTVSAGATQSATRIATAPADPRAWVGRWHGAGAAALQIMPSTDAGRYRLTMRSADGITTHYRATATGDRLIFDRGGRTLAIRTGRGNETDQPALARLTDCLIVVPGRQGFCRRADTADALPLATGAFVAVKSGCTAAQPADTLYFDGAALTRPGQNACHATVVGQKGVIFGLSDSCAAASSAANGAADETVSVPDPHHLSLHTAGRPTRLYRYCASGLLPPGLRAQARE